MKKGFTLIELLAVIVILAIIALIATPTILGVVETARKGAAESSILGYIDAIEKQVMINEMDDNQNNAIEGPGLTVDSLDMRGVTVKGQKPKAIFTKDGSCYKKGITVTNGEVQDAGFIYGENKYLVEYNKSTGKAEAKAYGNGPTLCGNN